MRLIYLLLFMAPQVLIYLYLNERLPDPTKPRQARLVRAALAGVFALFNFSWIFVAHRVLFGTVWGISWIPFTGPWVAWQLLGWVFAGLVVLYLAAKVVLWVVGKVERRPFVLDYAENDEMRVARPERLAEIVAVQGVPADAWITDSILPGIGAATPEARWQRAVAAMLEGEKGTALHLLLRLPGGEERGISVTRSVSLNDPWPLQPPALQIDSLPEGIVVVRLQLTDAGAVQQFDRAFPTFDGVRGLVVDLRGATGGRPDVGYRILARLTTGPFPTVLQRTPQYRPGVRVLGWQGGGGRAVADSATAWYTVPPDSVAPRSDRPAYTGPIALLASALTAGAAEDMLAAFRNAARGVIIGATSAGSPGVPLGLPLVKRWSLQLSVTREAFPNGTDFSGTGVAPDIPVVQTVSDLLTGRDAALERARAYLTTRPE